MFSGGFSIENPTLGFVGLFIFGSVAIMVLARGDGAPLVVLPIFFALLSALQFIVTAAMRLIIVYGGACP